MNYNYIIKKLIAEPLSSTDLLRKLNYKCNLIKYNELKNYNSIDELLYPYDACIILYELEPNFGHWTLVFKQNKSTIEHFDPLGIIIDDQLKYIDDYFKKVSNQNIPYLTYLLYISPYKIIYNDKKLQKDDKNVSTCGKWCIIRLLCRRLPLEKFCKLFDNIAPYSKDEYISLLTYLL